MALINNSIGIAHTFAARNGIHRKYLLLNNRIELQAENSIAESTAESNFASKVLTLSTHTPFSISPPFAILKAKLEFNKLAARAMLSNPSKNEGGGESSGGRADHIYSTMNESE